MNLDMLYEATNYTGNSRYADIATCQAVKCSDAHVRPNGTTYHLVNFDPRTGKGLEYMTAQGEPADSLHEPQSETLGYADESCWARGQAWAIYGYAQCGIFLSTRSNLC